MKKSYSISYKRGTHYKSITRTFNSELHLSRYCDTLNNSGSKVIDIFINK